MGTPLAIFDLDYTLIDADCELVWCDTLFELGIVDKAFMRRIDRFNEDYDAGHLNYAAFDECLLSPLAPYSFEKIGEFLKELLVRVKPLIRPWMMTRVDEHRRLGHEVLLATASNSFLAEPITALLNIPNLICTQVEMVEGKPTGKLSGREAFREGKVERVQQWIDRSNTSLAGSWGYSDSHNDIPILSRVDHPVAVQPDEKLRNHAVQNGWMILEKDTVPVYPVN